MGDEPPRCGADEDLTARGRFLETLRRVDGVARHERRRHVAGDDLPRVHADANLQVEHGRGVSHVDCRAHGPEGVVLVNRRHAEHRHRGIAHELLDRSTSALDRRSHRVVPSAHHRAQRLGVEPLPELRRIGEVAEEHGDGLPHQRASDGRRRRRHHATGEVERRVLAEDLLMQIA